MKINILSPAFSASVLLSLWTWFAFGVRGVRWFRSSVGPASMGLSGWGYPPKGAPAIRRTLTSSPRSESPASPPSPVRQTSQLEPGQEKLPYPSMPWGDLDPLCHAPRHLSWGQQDQGWGVGPCQEPRLCRALNDRSYSQVPRTEAPTPASATPQEPWPGESAWTWGRVGNLQRHGGRAPPSCPGLSPLSCGVPGYPHGATFPGLGRPYHPQSHEPPTLGCGPCIC